MNIRTIVRSLVKDWRFSLFVVVIVGVGIALNTATFTIADGILFEPLAVREPERLVRVFVKAPWGDKYWQQISYPAYRDLQEQTRSFQDVAAFGNDFDLDVTVAEGEPMQAKGAVATGNFFRTVGVRAQRGRLFGEGDSGVAVISDDFARAVSRPRSPRRGHPRQQSAADDRRRRASALPRRGHRRADRHLDPGHDVAGDDAEL